SGDVFQHFEIRAVQNLQRAVAAVRHENLLRFGHIENASRSGHARHALNPLASGQINDLQRIVAKSGDEETLAFGVDGEVIEATLDSVHRNSVSEFEAGFLCKAGTHPQSKKESSRAFHSMITC